MTFDPPCYISGYYEVIAAAIILGAIKLRQVADERQQEIESTSQPPELAGTEQASASALAEAGRQETLGLAERSAASKETLPPPPPST